MSAVSETTMRIHILVEGPSETALLRNWLLRFQPNHHHVIIEHQGRGRLSDNFDLVPNPKHRGLLDQLPAKLRAYGNTLDPATDRVLVLLDLDTSDCRELKARLIQLLAATTPAPMVMFRFAVEEVEAFYLGDKRAIRKSFSTIRRASYDGYVQDSICGTWETFQAVIAAPYIDKVGWAERIGMHLGIETDGKNANRSPSFREFCRALRFLAGEATT